MKYRVCYHKMKMREFTRIFSDKPWLIPFAFVIKTLRLPCIKGEMRYSVKNYDASEMDFSVTGLAKLKSNEAEVIANGYRRVGLDFERSADGSFLNMASLLYSPEEMTKCLIVITEFANGWNALEVFGFVTRVSNGGFVVSSNARGRMPSPDFDDYKNFKHANIGQLRLAHASRIQNLACAWVDQTDEQIKLQLQERVLRIFTHFVDRGIYVPLENA